MKLNRLLEITILLLNRKSVTASELAERFGVSLRTIYRDVEVLSTSGVPVYTTQGAGGGISILEGFSLDRATLSDSEKDNLLFALRTLQTTRHPEIDAVLEKLGALFHNSASDWISIDFSPWGSDPNQEDKFLQIKTAVLQRRVIAFDYINARNQRSSRLVEPLRLCYKSQAWYLVGFCRERRASRVFRISRIKRLRLTETCFTRAPGPPAEQRAEENGMSPSVHLVLRFTEQALYRLYDDYDDDVLRDNADGTYTVEVDFPEDEWVYGYILSFGPYVEVLAPAHIRGIVRERAQKILARYPEPDS